MYPDGDLRVAVGNQTWTFNHLCCSLAPQTQPDINNTNGNHEREEPTAACKFDVTLLDDLS